mgnify:FL=1
MKPNRDDYATCCAGKYAFPDRDSAQAARRDMGRSGRMLTALDIYLCPHGKHYHIAHALPKPNQKETRRERHPDWFAALDEIGS